jgi:hypothetical protein
MLVPAAISIAAVLSPRVDTPLQLTDAVVEASTKMP